MIKKLLLSTIYFAFLPFGFAQNQLFIPDTLTGSNINLNIQNGNVQFYQGNTTATMGVNGNLLGPTLILRKNSAVTINVKNLLNDTTTVHWHGMHVAAQNDGGPHTTILPGQIWSPSFTVLDWAATYWYHPHLHHKTNEHTLKGIAGLIIVRDSLENTLGLPRTYGVDDIPLVVQTKCFDANNQIVTAHVATDTALMVNGTFKPYVNLPAQVVRFRVLNGSSERVYNFGFSDNRVFFQIATDGGLLTAPISLTRLQLAPGERAEILVNFGSDQSNQIQLMSYAAELPNAIYGATQPGMGAGQVIAGYSTNPLNGKNFTVLTINIGAKLNNAIITIPTILAAHNPYIASQAQATKTLVFTSTATGPAAINGPFLINGMAFNMMMVNYQIPFNNIEIWELRNQTPIAHPFHIHDVQFYVLDINGNAPAANLQGRKDVILVPGGNTTVRFITKFDNFYNDTLPYMYHCHMLTHEDEGMMGQFVVNSPCNLIKAHPDNVNANVGSSIQMQVLVNDTINTIYQWQSNIGFGFQDIQNIGQYQGVTTKTLSINNLSLTNNNQTFRCKVTKNGCNETSNEATLNVLSAFLNQIENKILIGVYPNPAKNQLNLLLPNNLNKDLNFSITNLVGEQVLKGNCNVTNIINIEDLNTGVYIIHITQNNQVYIAKFIKH